MKPIVICILYKILTVNASVLILYECCTILLQKEFFKSSQDNTAFGKKILQNNYKTIIITGMRKNVHMHNVISTFQGFGHIDYIALASLSRDFGFVRYNNENTSKMILQKFRTGEIVVQDVAVVVKTLSSYVTTSTLSTSSLSSLDDSTSALSQDPRILNNNIIHLLSENSCSNMKSLLRMSSSQLRNISSDSNNSSDTYSSNISNSNSLFPSSLRRSTSFPNNINHLMSYNDDDEDDDFLFNDNNNDDQQQEVHLMRQLSMFNPYIDL